MKLFDTSFLIDLVNGDPGAVREAEESDRTGEIRAVSAITAEEYLYGIHNRHTGTPTLNRRLQQAEEDLAHFQILPCDMEVARVAAEIGARLDKRGASLDLADILIASTALRHRLSLVTRDVEHFRRVPGLAVERY